MSTDPDQPVDLARARAAEEALAHLLAEKPHLRERTAEMLAGDLPCPDLEEPTMPEKANLNPVTLRLPAAMLSRADALIEQAPTIPELAVVPKATRADILRVALLRGLTALEAEVRPESP